MIARSKSRLKSLSNSRNLLRLSALFAIGVISTPVLAATPVLVKDINPGAESSNAGEFVPFAGQLLFTANDGAHGVELWKTDGTTAGTQLVIDLRPGADNSVPINLTAVNGDVWFSAYDSTPAVGSKVFRTDGTSAGTQFIFDTYPGAPGGFFGPPLPGHFTALNGTTVLFTATDADHGLEPWRSDGTSAGTSLVKDIHPGMQWSVPIELTTLNGVTYFAADHEHMDNPDGSTTFNRELWRTDGTTAGTYLVKDINPGIEPSTPTDFRLFNNQIYFAATEPVHGRQLWKTDGSTSGTVQATNVTGGGSGFNLIQDVKPFNNQLIFLADDGVHGSELWQTDGSSAGAHLIKDINPAGDANAFQTTAIGNRFLFSADDGEHGSELWVSDGTDAGTNLLKDINPGADFSSPNELTAVGDTVYFVTVHNDPVTFAATSALWVSDGTESGTQLVWEAPGQAFQYNIYDLQRLGDRLLFMAPTSVDQDGFSFNYELHAIDVPEPATTALLMTTGLIPLIQRRRTARRRC